MIKMTYSQLSSVEFQKAAQKLGQMPMRSPEAFRIKHVLKALQEKVTFMGESFKKRIVAEYGADGDEPKPVTGKSLELELPFNAIAGKEEAALEAFKKFRDTEFTINQNPISGEVLFQGGSWSAIELSHLEPLVVELYVAPEEKVLRV